MGTAGNPDAHLILRGGTAGPNYGIGHVNEAAGRLSAAGLNERLIIDASHANSGKNHHRQAQVALEIAADIQSSPLIAGVMLESFLVGGAQPLDVGRGVKPVYGQSVTDACMEWSVTASVLEQLALSSGVRRTSGL